MRPAPSRGASGRGWSGVSPDPQRRIAGAFRDGCGRAATPRERDVRNVSSLRRALGALVSQPVPAKDEARAPVPDFDEVYDLHFSFVWRNARRMGTPTADIDDVAQEIFMVAHRRLADFEGRSSLRTWLLGIVVNVVRAHRRKLSVRHPHVLSAAGREEPDGITDAADGPHEHVTKSEAARVVDRLLESLDDHGREVFVLVELEQMTAPEIATALGIPLNTVYSRLRRARQEFAEAVRRHQVREKGYAERRGR